MSINLNLCDKTCFGCIKNYKNKHQLGNGEKFHIRCNGIPKDYIDEVVAKSINEDELSLAKSMLDPVTWAAETLDWHCLDPDGSIWKRKNPEEYNAWVEENPGKPILGNSRYHRPYQATMLRCTSKRKVFRIGRQAGKTETLVISMLFNLFTKPGVTEGQGFKIVLITPFQTQIDLIFTRLNELIAASKTLQDSIKRNVKAPTYTLELNNRSVVRGFTAGTKSGNDAAAVRGQTGNMLVFDEADYLSRGDVDAAMSIITNYPNATLWMSSTPSGKRERFFESCESRRYKEFHFPSKINPMWTADTEASFREDMTEIGYKHECDAEFGEQEEGVFQNAYIQRAKQSYSYGDFAYDSSWTYMLGVDWNDTANGTTIAVVGFSPQMRKFILVNRYIVSRDGWTQIAAMEKIVQLNKFWRPMAIYIDKGHGGTQYELLREYGFNSFINKEKGPTHPDAKLREIVKQYDFGSTVEIRDPFTKQKMKKPAKPFLVETTVRRFEANDFVFSDSDELFEKQLHGYVIDRITPSGNPVYKPIDEKTGDHTLDAIMLALMGFTMEVSPLGKPKYNTRISFSGYFGDRTEADPNPGGLTVHAKSNKEKFKNERERAKPNISRSELQETSLLQKNDLPANHIYRESTVKPWSHPGFLKDEPAPRVRTLREAENVARQRTGLAPRRGIRPRRKNI